MSIREYIREVGKHLNKFYLPPEVERTDEIVASLIKHLNSNIFNYFDDNIAPEMVAEFIAHDLGLTINKSKVD